MMETALRKCSKLIQYRWLVAISAFVSGSFCQAQAPDALQSLGLDNPAKESVVVLAGPDASHQLLVSGKYQQGKVRDLTRTVSFAAAPQGIVNIDPVGLVTPLKDGETTIQIKVQGGKQIAVKFRVTDLLNDVPISFPNQVVPIFSKFGCNGGGCHGKAGGQNGFALSLLGFEPAEDYEFLVKEDAGPAHLPRRPRAKPAAAQGDRHRALTAAASASIAIRPTTASCIAGSARARLSPAATTRSCSVSRCLPHERVLERRRHAADSR